MEKRLILRCGRRRTTPFDDVEHAAVHSLADLDQAAHRSNAAAEVARCLLIGTRAEPGEGVRLAADVDHLVVLHATASMLNVRVAVEQHRIAVLVAARLHVTDALLQL